MTSILSALFLILAPPALAQDDLQTVQTPGEAATGTEGATTMWTTAPVELRRFADGDTVTVSLAANTEVTLVVADGDQYRVRRGSDFGWLQAEQVTQVPQLAAPGLQLTPPPL